ncbi:MAG TPA: type II secretion system protein [Planctomycetaceae bacterium]|jgi:prepilin-type N-terminal cleavage/methylation domain-containing protein|nr:type II secretion system protein [Planctomycetaceae bacterium]
MTQAREDREGRQSGPGSARKNRGYSLIEVIFAVVIILILAAFAVPQMGTVIFQYRLQGAVASATWAVQSTRYQALMAGFPYQVVFKKATNNYQIQDLPPGAGAYANVGTAVPLSGTTIALNQDTTFRFLPNGSVSAPTGALNNFTITYHGSTKTITVSTYGNVKVM